MKLDYVIKELELLYKIYYLKVPTSLRADKKDGLVFFKMQTQLEHLI